MIAVITGSNGFIGSALVKELIDNGDEVRCLIRKPEPPQDDGVKRFVIDYMNPDQIVASGALDGADILYHVAGVTKALSLASFRAGNVKPTQNLLEAAARRCPALKRFVLISSQAASGPAKSLAQPVQESDDPAPVEDYGRSKLEAENLLRDQDHPFPYTIIRPAAVYGPRDADFLSLFKQLQKGVGIYPGNRDSYVALIHVDDLVKGIFEASQATSAENQVYYLTNEVAISWQEIYHTLSELLDKRIFELNVPFPIIALAGKIGDMVARFTGKVTVLNSKKIDLARPRYWTCTAEKAKAELNFQPAIAMRQGFKETIAWYRMEGWM